MPEPAKILALVRKATVLNRATKGRRGGLVAPDAEDIVVMGDLHGNIRAFQHILKRAALERNPNRHIVLQELVHGKWSYPDESGGGDRSHQLIDLAAAYKCQFPDRVHIILGNHELSELTSRPIIKDGAALNASFRKGVETAYGAAAQEVIAAYHRFFESLPLAVMTSNKVLIVHTLPDAADLDKLESGLFDRSGPWSPAETARGGVVYALTWGRDISIETADRFAKITGADLFINGHIPCDHGFHSPNPRRIILDGTDPYPGFCTFPASGEISIDRLLEGSGVVPMAT